MEFKCGVTGLDKENSVETGLGLFLSIFEIIKILACIGAGQ